MKCFIEAHPAVTVAVTPEQAARLKREQKARRAAGLDAPLLNARAIAGEVGARRERRHCARKDGATLDPYRACLGLAAAAAQRGVALFERSPVTKDHLQRERRGRDHRQPAASARSASIVATGMPTPLFKSLARHFWFQQRFFAQTEPVPAKIRNLLGRRDAVCATSRIRRTDPLGRRSDRCS